MDRAIPDYDVLAASQVVRRLDGLTPAELRAVLRHERAGRGRRTIVHRAEHLLAPASDTDATDVQGGGDPPGQHAGRDD